MKKTIVLLFAVIVSAITFTAFEAEENPRVIAIVNKADWCSICKAFAGRTVATFNENNEDNYFQFIVYDITNDETKKASKPVITKVGLEKALDNSLAAGVLSFYDARSKTLLAQVTVANTTEELAATMKMVRGKVSK